MDREIVRNIVLLGLYISLFSLEYHSLVESCCNL